MTGKRLDISAVMMPNRMCYVIDIYPFYSLKALLGGEQKKIFLYRKREPLIWSKLHEARLRTFLLV